VTPPDAGLSAQNRRASADERIAMWRAISSMRSAEAQSSATIVYLMSRNPSMSDYGHYAKAVTEQNHDQGDLSKGATSVLGIVARWWGISRVADAGGGTETKIENNGDGNSVAGRNNFDSRSVDNSATTTTLGDNTEQQPQ